MKTIQQQLADRIYKILPNKVEVIAHYQGEQEPSIEHIELQLHLADLLLAIQEANPLVNYAMDITGEMIISEGIYRHNYVSTLNNYNLSQDNILDQSDEFCKYVLEILNK